MLLSLAIAFVFGTASLGTDTAHAASKKEYLKISDQVIYYGQLKDGKPNGRGTMTWNMQKSYSGDWVDGKRTGTGKYVNNYTIDGKVFLITYNGAWKDDLKVGSGTYIVKTSDSNGAVASHKIQSGTFSNDQFVAGYSVAHSTADPPYSFNYKDSKLFIQLNGSNHNMQEAWKNGEFVTMQYKKGQVLKHYSPLFNDNPSMVKQNKQVLKYLQGIQPEIKSYLDKFQQLSKQVPLS